MLTARVAAITQETAAVKSIELEYGAQPFRFRPGQWIDLTIAIDGNEHVGGYSMVSTPQWPGRLQLGVKQATHHPVTRYIHERLRIGEHVRISQGQGTMTYEDADGGPVVLIGAGIGITPLLSILRWIDGRWETAPDTAPTRWLIYGNRSWPEVPFASELYERCQSSPRGQGVFALSEQAELTGQAPGEPQVVAGRIDPDLLIRLNPPRDGLYFLCGPQPLVELALRTLRALGIPPERIRYERWW